MLDRSFSCQEFRHEPHYQQHDARTQHSKPSCVSSLAPEERVLPALLTAELTWQAKSTRTTSIAILLAVGRLKPHSSSSLRHRPLLLHADHRRDTLNCIEARKQGRRRRLGTIELYPSEGVQDVISDGPSSWRSLQHRQDLP